MSRIQDFSSRGGNGKAVTYAQVTSALSAQGIPYNTQTVQQMCGGTEHYCGCGAKPRLDGYGVMKYDCGCSAGKPSLH